jgi:hypothetical protein
MPVTSRSLQRTIVCITTKQQRYMSLDLHLTNYNSR